MPVTRHPPHRSRRAARPHRAPASGDDAQAPEGAYRRGWAHVTGVPGAVSGSWSAPPRSPWPVPCPLPAPPVPWGAPCSKASAVLWSCPTPCTRASRSYPVGAPCGPGALSSGQLQGLPGSVPRVSVHARGRRPRQGCPPLALAGGAVWPAACSERVGTQDWPMSGRNTLPAPSPVNASPTPLPTPAHDSGPVWLARPSRSGTYTLSAKTRSVGRNMIPSA